MKRTLFTLVFTALVVVLVSGQTPGNALSFDGVDDQVNASVPTLFSDLASNDFTIEAWVNPALSVFSRIVFAQYSTVSFATLSLSATNSIYFYVVVGGTTYSLATDSSISSNQWTHVAARWTASTLTPEVFFNGVLQTGANGGTSSTGTSGLLCLGTRPGGFQFFTGQIDEVRIWKTARTDCEISMNYQSVINVVDTNLICFYNCNEGVAGGTNTSVTLLPDQSGPYNGTLVNFALTGSSSNWVQSAATINNYNSGAGYIEVADTISVCSGTSYTFPDGYTENNITAPMIHTSMLQTALLCDSIVNTAVNVMTVDTSVTGSGITLTANGPGTYQWLDCNNLYTEIPGSINNIFTATSNGSYAVEITSGSCVDTSGCFVINEVGIETNDFGSGFIVYPNPGDGHYSIDLGQQFNDVQMVVYDVNGKEILKKTFGDGQFFCFDIINPAGVYSAKIFTGEKSATLNIVKQ